MSRDEALHRETFMASQVGTETRLLLIGIPVFIWTMLRSDHRIPVRDLAQAVRKMRSPANYLIYPTFA